VTRVAAVDLGTNTVRLLVAEPCEHGFDTVYSGQIITRLGEGLHNTGRLSPQAMKRTVEGIASLLREAERFRPFTLTIAATSAARDAANTSEFDAALRNAVGTGLKVIPWEEEASLALLGASLAVGNTGRFVLFDVGGGSTEYILADGGKPAASYGTKLGVVRLAETYIKKNPVADAEYQRLLDEVEATVDKVFSAIPYQPGDELVGTAGTVTSLAAMALNMVDYNPAKINNYRLTASAIEDLRMKVFAMPISARSRIPALKNGREDLIVPGFAIVQATMRRAGADHILVSDYGLREGLVMRLLNGGF